MPCLPCVAALEWQYSHRRQSLGGLEDEKPLGTILDDELALVSQRVIRTRPSVCRRPQMLQKMAT